MENAKLYSPQDIEQLKQKIEAYKETLTTLKKDTSIEDCLLMKSDFDTFKKQIAHLDGLTTRDIMQNMQIDEYGEQVKQMSIQIDALHHNVEEINQEILTVIKKIIANAENKIAPVNHTTTLNKDSSPSITEEKMQTNLSITNNQPTFMQLQSLAGKAIDSQNQEITTTANEHLEKSSQVRHFNEQYFQLTSTHPSHIYNGLFKKATRGPSLQFKNAADIQEISIDRSTNHNSPSVVGTNEPVESSISPSTDSISLEEKEPIKAEVSLSLDVAELEQTSEQSTPSNEMTQEETKKEKTNIFFNLFRKRN